MRTDHYESLMAGEHERESGDAADVHAGPVKNGNANSSKTTGIDSSALRNGAGGTPSVDWGMVSRPVGRHRLVARIIVRQMWRSKARFLSVLGSTVFSCASAMAALSITGASGKFEMALMVAAVSCLIVGVVSISQSLKVAAVESRDDDQMLLASGFPASTVMWIVLMEAVVSSLAGAVLGVVIGYGIARVGVPLLVAQEIHGFMSLETVYRPWAVGLVLVGGTLTALVAAASPARMAMRMDWSSEGSLDLSRPRHASMVTWAVGSIAFLAGIVLMVWSSSTGVEPSWTVVLIECLLFVIGLYVSYPMLFRALTGGLGWIVERVFHCKRPSVLVALRSVRLRNSSSSAVSAAVTVGLLFLATVTMIGSWDSTHAQMEMAATYQGTSQVRLRKSTGLDDFQKSDIQAWKRMDGVKQVLTFSAHESRMESSSGKHVKVSYYTIDGNPFEGLVAGDEAAGTAWSTGRGAIVGCELVRNGVFHVGDSYMIGKPGRFTQVRVIGETCNAWLDDALLIPSSLMPEHDITSVYIVHDQPVDSKAFNEMMTEEYPGYVFFDRESMVKRFGTTALWELLVYYGAGALIITVAVSGLFTMMALSVMQRKRELGLLSAYGMSNGQMRASIWLEAGIVSLIAGVLGTGMGSVLGVVIGKKLGMTIIDSSTWLLEGWLVIATVIVGVFAAVIPSFVAVRAGASTIRDE